MLKLSRAFPCYPTLQINGLANCHRKSDSILPSDATQGESSSLLTLREGLSCMNSCILLEMTFQSQMTFQTQPWHGQKEASHFSGVTDTVSQPDQGKLPGSLPDEYPLK